MKANNDNWIHTIRHRLDEASVPLDTGESWMRMERKIQRFFRIRMWKRAGLAAACAAAILGPVLLLHIGGTGVPDQPVRIVKLHYEGAGLTCKAERPVSKISILPGSRSGFVATQPAPDPETAPAYAKATAQEQAPVTVAEAEAEALPAGEIATTRPVYNADPFAQSAEQTKSRKKFMVSAAGLLNVSRGSAAGALPMNDLIMSSNRLATYGLKQIEAGSDTYNASFASVSFVQYEYKHRIPVSFGIFASLPVSEHWFVESGLFATRLATSIYSETFMETRPSNSEPVFITDRVLWYLGVPLKIRWNFVQNKYFIAYASAGGMLEKCVSFDYSRDMDDENMQFTTKQIPLQWSVNATLGAQYNIVSMLGLFIEPGVSFFFVNDNPVYTIRGERPLYLNLNAGIRFMF